MVKGIMAGLLIPVYKTSITNHLEITSYADWVFTALLVTLMALDNEMYQDRGLNCVRYQGSMVLVTGLSWWRGAKWNLGQDIDDCLLDGVWCCSWRVVSVIKIPTVIYRLLILWDCSEERLDE